MNRRGRRKGSRGRAEDRVRDRVRRRTRRGEGRAGRTRGTFDADAIEGYANRLRDHIEDNPEVVNQRLSDPELRGATSGLAGAAAGLAGSSFAHRLQGSDAGSSEEEFRTEVSERLDLMDERLARLEDDMRSLLEGEAPRDLGETGSGSEPHSDR